MFQWIERIFLRMLLLWALLSMILGIVMVWPAWGKPEPSGGEVFISSMGSQFFIWGCINALLAGKGLADLARRERAPLSPADESARQAKVRRALEFNGKLDWGWISIGVALVVVGFLNPAWASPLFGHGAGVIVQGAFLLLFDHLFHRRLAVEDTAAADRS